MVKLNPGLHIDHIKLLQINSKAARQAVLDYLRSEDIKYFHIAKMFGLKRCVIFEIQIS